MVQWKPIPLNDFNYEVSEIGQIRNKNGVFLKPFTDIYGYQHVNLRNKGKRKNVLVHRMVALAFMPNPNNCPIVHHKDDNKQNVCVSNLEWVNRRQHANNHGSSLVGENNPSSKLTFWQVMQIREVYALGILSQREIARRYSVSHTTIQDIVNNRRWKPI